MGIDRDPWVASVRLQTGADTTAREQCRRDRWSWQLLAILAIVSVALPGAACAGRARAETVAAEPTPLEVPPPPPRVLAPVLEPIAAEPEPPTPVATAPEPPPRTPVRRAGNSDPEPRTEAAAEPPAPPAPTASAEAPRELRASPSADDAEVVRKVREVLDRAARDLNRVTYGRLSADGRMQYDESKRFSDRAEEALKDRNFVFALNLAERAATIAALLPSAR
jgi:hypothetical protein